jgi:hypothetical protein
MLFNKNGAPSLIAGDMGYNSWEGEKGSPKWDMALFRHSFDIWSRTLAGLTFEILIWRKTYDPMGISDYRS